MTLSTVPQSAHGSSGDELDPRLLDVLATSRANWKAVAVLAYEFCFETDDQGRFVMVSSDAFGWTQNDLLGRTGTSLLEWPVDEELDPFRSDAPVKRRRAWLKRVDGSVAAVLISAQPCRDRIGRITGLVGGVTDISEQEVRIQGLTARLQTFKQVEAITRAMRHAVLPDLMIRIGLEQLLEALGGYGAVIVGGTAAIAGANPAPFAATRMTILHRAGGAAPAPDDALIAFCRDEAADSQAPWSRIAIGFGRPVALAAIATHFSEPVILLVWREPGRGWLPADEALVSGAMTGFGGVLDQDQIQRETSRQSSVDTLTGLLNRANFLDEVNRRLERLDAEQLSATMMLVGLDKFDAVNRTRGFEAGDKVLKATATMLRDAVRPTDLACRLGGDLFALWLDGADQFAAAERAEGLCKAGVSVEDEEPIALSLSIGLTSRAPRSFESTETLLEQAQAALSAIKLAGGGRWHFYNEDIST